jgi:uncharacterized protein (TIGR02145 family)
MIKRIFILLSIFLLSCGNDDSNNPSGIGSETLSSSIIDENLSSNMDTLSSNRKSSSVDKVKASSSSTKSSDSKSSQEKMSSSLKEKKSSSSNEGAFVSSSRNEKRSSSSLKSSDSDVDNSSNSEKNSSSEKNLSFSETSSSSNAGFSTSEESSSSRTSSSSFMEISSSIISELSSSSRKVAEIKPNNYYKMNCPEGMVCKYVITEFLNQEFLASNKYGEILDDRDGFVYKTIKIDNYNWTAQNMNYDTTGFCQDDIPLNCEKYGRIYNKNVAIRICPSGWHLPDSSEWRKLIEFAQKYANVENAGSVLKSQNGGWSAYLETNDKEKCDLKQTVNCIDGNGSDELGFSAVPQAEKANTVGGFSNYGHHSSLWMKKPYGHFTIYFSNYFGLGSSGTGANYLHSVRCIKDW